MKKRFCILRQACASAEQNPEPYFEEFTYETENPSATIATALEHIERQSEKTSDRPLAWEHSCLQKKCGACAMVINGTPALACDVRLADLNGDTITVEPLKKFPVVEDLRVDRSAMPRRLLELNFYSNIGEKASTVRTVPAVPAISYESARCLQCGLCLEVCPNYAPDKTKFSGMAAMTTAARLLANLPDEKKDNDARAVKKRIAKAYRKGVYEGCGKSLACRDICPVKLDMELLLSRTNATAVWHR